MVGKVISQNKKSITFENNYTGYVVYVTNPQDFEINRVRKIYLYKHLAGGNKNNFIEELYGFDKYETKELFISLIAISGIGPKTAMNICRNDCVMIKQLIAKRDVDSLASLEGLTVKYAKLIIDNLYEDYHSKELNDNNLDIANLIKALKSLGYNANEIEMAIRNINVMQTNMELSDLISQAIKIIATQQEKYGSTAKAH
ncbi:MAG: hypothetical protein LBV37_03380 [Mycoplasmataceae bacterium]|jgi:Holliday junction DNA helicase RuvA|nr:hypothetical protein [Mycoplasmataceae bacterium]